MFKRFLPTSEQRASYAPVHDAQARARPSVWTLLRSKLLLRLFILLVLVVGLASTAVHVNSKLSMSEKSQTEGASLELDASGSHCTDRRQAFAKLAMQVKASQALAFQGTVIAGRNLTISLHPTLRDAQHCYTSVNRFAPYEALTEDLNPNGCGNTQSLVIRLEPDHQYTPDFNNHLTTLIVEVAWPNAMDVRILQQFDDRNDWPDDRTPEQFRSMVTFFHADDAFRPFAQHKNHIDTPTFNYQRHPGRYMSRYSHVAEVYLFNIFPKYEFAWFMNAKVRSTGPWSLQFAPLLADIAAQERPPDLVTFDPIVSAPAKANWPKLKEWRPEHYVSSALIIHGISNRMAKAMSDYLENGFNAIVEAFVPAVAIKHQVFRILVWPHTSIRKSGSQLGFPKWRALPESKIQVLGMPNGTEWEYGVSWSSDRQTSWQNELYQDWALGSIECCLPALLFHPVSGK